MKYNSDDIAGLFKELSNSSDVHGHYSSTGFNSAGIMPVWVSVAWYYREDVGPNICEDPWQPTGPNVFHEDCS